MSYNNVRAVEKPKHDISYNSRSDTTNSSVNIDTTTLRISIKTTGDFTTEMYDYIPFHPNMVDIKDLDHNNYILFPDYIKITMRQLKRSEMNKNLMKNFTSIKDFIKLIKYAASKDKESDDKLLVYDTDEIFENDLLSDSTSNNIREIQKKEGYEKLEKSEIITNNIGVIKSVFFPIDGKLFLFGHTFIIKKSKFVYNYIRGGKPNKGVYVDLEDQPPLLYSAIFELNILDATNNPNLNDYSSLACANKKLQLKNDIKMLLDTQNNNDIKYKTPLPIVNNKLTSITKDRKYNNLQTDWEKRNMYVMPPVNENERIDRINRMPPLAAKIAVFKDKMARKDFRDIPPLLWITEYNLLDKKIDILKEYLARNKHDSNYQLDSIKQYIALKLKFPNYRELNSSNNMGNNNTYQGEIIKFYDIKTPVVDTKILDHVENIEKIRINELYKIDKEAILDVVDKKIEELVESIVKPDNEDNAGRKKEKEAIMRDNIVEYISRNSKKSKKEDIREKVNKINDVVTAKTQTEIIKKNMTSGQETDQINSWVNYKKEIDDFKKRIATEKESGDEKKTRDDAKLQMDNLLSSLNKLNKLYQHIGATTTNKNPIYGFNITNDESREYNNKELEDNYDLETLKSEREEKIKLFLELSAEINKDDNRPGIIKLLTIDKKNITEIKVGRRERRDIIEKLKNEEIKNRTYLIKTGDANETSTKISDLTEKLNIKEYEYKLLNFIEDTLNEQINKIQKNYQADRNKKQTSRTPDELYGKYNEIVKVFNEFTEKDADGSNGLFNTWKTGKQFKPIKFDRINLIGGGVNKNKNSKKTQKYGFRKNLYNTRNITKKHRKVYV